VVDVSDNQQIRAERSLLPLHNDAHVPNFEQQKCCVNASSQRQVHDKIQYLERIADAAFEILKEKFHYVSDQLELNSKQHQALNGRFVSFLQEHVVIGFNSSCYDIHWRMHTCWDTCLLFGFVKTG